VAPIKDIQNPDYNSFIFILRSLKLSSPLFRSKGGTKGFQDLLPPTSPPLFLKGGVGTCILFCFGFIILAHPARSPDGGFAFASLPHPPTPQKNIIP